MKKNKQYVRIFLTRLEAREDIKLEQICEHWGTSLNGAIRRLIREKKIN